MRNYRKSSLILLLLMFLVVLFVLIQACKPVENPPPLSPGKYTIHTQYWTFYTNFYEFIPNTNCIKYKGVDANSQKERITCGDFTAYQTK